MAKRRKVSPMLIVGIVLLLIAVTVGAYAWFGNFINFGACLVGSGNVISESRSVDTFHSVELKCSGNLYVTQNGLTDIQVEADDNILPQLKTYVNNDVLIVEMQMLGCLLSMTPINVYVSMSEINKLSILGSGNINGETEIATDSLELLVSGSGDINLDVDVRELESSILGSGNIILRGVATEHEATITGSGNIQSYDLSTEKSTAVISGSGSSYISVSNELDATVYGSGGIYYQGNPSDIDTFVSGSGRLTKVE